MAKNNLGTLAGIAALGSLAYINRDKLGFGDNGDLDREKQTLKLAQDSRQARPPSTETREEPRRQITDYQKKAPLDGTEMYPSGVMGGATQAVTPPPAVTSPIPPKAIVSQKQLADFQQRFGQEKTLRDYMNAQRASKNPPLKIPNSMQNLPNNESNRNPPVVIPKSMQNLPNDQRSMAGRPGYDEAGNPMKKGGAVKKMASGGMTASRRGDGIASRGKTRGKIC